MRGNRAFLAAMLLITLGAFMLRSVNLGNRPMHGDEAVHAEKFRDLWEKGVYRYDSNEYHGPTIYYAALPSVILHGRKSWPDTREADYRLPIAVFGAAMILLLLPLAPTLGRTSMLAAGVFIAISPAFVFYSRYFIQEVPFVFFTLAMIVCGWRYAQTQRKGWLVLSGISAGMMIATKETAVLSFVAMGVSVWLTAATMGKAGDSGSAIAASNKVEAAEQSVSPVATGRVESDPINIRTLFSARALGIATLIALITGCLFISGFGTNIHGPIDYIRAYGPWFHRAQGASIHNHPFGYYLKLLVWSRITVDKTVGSVWSESLIVVLAIAGAIVAFSPRMQLYKSAGSAQLWRFVAFYTLSLTLVYSVIPYKTPWCLLSFLLGMCLLAGFAVATLLQGLGSRSGSCEAVPLPVFSAAPARSEDEAERARERLGEGGIATRIALLAVVLIAASQLANQAYRASFVSYADPTNPYVYAATAATIVDFQKRIDDVAKYWPEHNNMVIKVFSNSNYYWPLPWYLRRYPHVGWYSHPPASKEEAAAPVTVCAVEMDEQMSDLLNDTDLMNGIDEVRNGVFYETFIRMDVWTTYLNGKNGGVIKRIAPPPPAE
jgi:uncharacterized protein (TIGR03663 family)